MITTPAEKKLTPADQCRVVTAAGQVYYYPEDTKDELRSGLPGVADLPLRVAALALNERGLKLFDIRNKLAVDLMEIKE